VVEALSAGVPVIASDIPVFRAIGGDHVMTIDPIDGIGWRSAIRAFTPAGSVERDGYAAKIAGYDAPNWSDLFERVEAFLEELPRTARGADVHHRCCASALEVQNTLATKSAAKIRPNRATEAE
jgi:glycosyltransferase involved in cell wall biosynthesis